MPETTPSSSSTALDHVKLVANKDAKNYAVAAAAASLALVNLTANWVEGCSASLYLNLLTTTFLTGVAVNQFGMDESRSVAIVAGQKAFNAASSAYQYGMSLFATKPEATVAAKEVVNVAKSEKSEKPATRSMK